MQTGVSVKGTLASEKAIRSTLASNSSRPPTWGLTHVAQPLERPANGHKKAGGVPDSFSTNSSDGFFDGFSLAEGISQSGDFERLLFGILARLVNSPAEEAEREIEDALKRLCRALGVEHAGLRRNSAQNLATFLLTQHSVLPSFSEADPGARNPTISLAAQSKACCPWITAEAKRGERLAKDNGNHQSISSTAPNPR
jgi:hypothetical protein